NRIREIQAVNQLPQFVFFVTRADDHAHKLSRSLSQITASFDQIVKTLLLDEATHTENQLGVSKRVRSYRNFFNRNAVVDSPNLCGRSRKPLRQMPDVEIRHGDHECRTF